MDVIGIPVWNDTVETGYRRALAEHEPVFVPAQHFADDRGWSLMNQLQGRLESQGPDQLQQPIPGCHQGVAQT